MLARTVCCGTVGRVVASDILEDPGSNPTVINFYNELFFLLKIHKRGREWPI